LVAKSPQGVKSAQELEDYWTKNPEGLAKWATTDQPWTNLYHHLLKYLNPDLAKKTASRWFIKVFHYAAGSDANRVAHGHPPRGKVVGPG